MLGTSPFNSKGGKAGDIGGGPPGSYVGVVLLLPLATGNGVFVSRALN